MTAIDERALEAARRAYEAKERDAFGPCPTEHPDDGGGPLGYAITAYLQALRPGSTGETEGWRDIKSAPMDGTRILATDGDTVEVVEWGDISMGSTKGWQISCNSDSGWNYYDYLVDPTHWMPLPSPPSAMLAAAGGRDE